MSNYVSKRTTFAYILLVDQPNGWRSQSPEDYMRSYTASLSTEFVPKGSLVEFDPLCLPLSENMKSINVISLDNPQIKAPVMLRELRPLEEHEYELLKPLSPMVT